MSQNPYAHPGQFGIDGGDEIPPRPARTSILAVFSLVCSLICCIPGLGLVGSVLGIGALVGISSSKGRVGGKGLAIAGVVIGLIVTTLWVFGAYGAASIAARLMKYEGVVTALEQGDVPAARAFLSPSADGAVPDERLAEFAAAIRSDWGGFSRGPKGLLEMVRWYWDDPSTPVLIETAQGDLGMHANALFPLPLAMDGGRPLFFFVMDTQGGGSFPQTLLNLGFERADGSVEWLIDPSGP